MKLTSIVESENASAVNGYVEIPWKLSSDSTGAVNVSYVSMRGTRAPAAPVNLTILNEELLHVVDHNPVISWDFIDPDSETQGRFELEVGTPCRRKVRKLRSNILAQA